MNEIFKPGAGVLYMKVGTHANETLSDIIARKSQEIDEAGYAMWGYGGNTCHPASMVQPFAKAFAGQHEPIFLVMEAMDSKHFAEPLCAAEYSADGHEWKEIPPSIEVRGSRYALTIDSLEVVEMSLPLHNTRVPVGPSSGRSGSKYISGRVDKACLEILSVPNLINDPPPERQINLVGKLRQPYAVFLRNYR